MKLSDYNYFLPKDLIAQLPLLERERARLLVIKRKEKEIEHCLFPALLDYLSSGDLLVLNDTKVIPARLRGKKETGGRAELLLLHRLEENIYEALARPRIKVGSTISFNKGIKAKILEREHGKYRVEFVYPGKIEEILEKIGEIPLPPYIKRKPLPIDMTYYQTVYSKRDGAIAAPTAGLHFTEGFLQKVKEKGVNIAFVTLNIGWGTFKPIREENIEKHRMEKEYFELPFPAAKLINKTKKDGKRIIAVGTTSVRVLEATARSNGRVEPKKGWTSLYIYPGYKFKITESILTNFHLPSTTLFLLIAAFAGKELIQRAYQEAIERKYRFASYGDAMLIL
ncbi:MAG: tRNA preQ1(34) S-adenosylmethionine ribosyltransferase-isomerase QueA [Candidatus Omnitrophica bacterium]|nr:tRNA preQ1(34) S-adenosylmethionine ribosyltransferase-isomerase QueA [Candidatus Omnitrophota bacterium]